MCVCVCVCSLSVLFKFKVHVMYQIRYQNALDISEYLSGSFRHNAGVFVLNKAQQSRNPTNSVLSWKHDLMWPFGQYQ